jgi:hypothetical protein
VFLLAALLIAIALAAVIVPRTRVAVRSLTRTR